MTKSAQLRWKRLHAHRIAACRHALEDKLPVWHQTLGQGLILNEWGTFSDPVFEAERLKNWEELSPEAKKKLPYNPEIRRISGDGVFDVYFRIDRQVHAINADHLQT